MPDSTGNPLIHWKPCLWTLYRLISSVLMSFLFTSVTRPCLLVRPLNNRSRLCLLSRLLNNRARHAAWPVQDFCCAGEMAARHTACLVQELCWVKQSQFYCVKNSQFYCVKLYRSPFRAQASRAILKFWKSSVSAIFNYTPYVGGLGVTVFFGSFLLLSEEMNENNTKHIQE